MYRVQCKQGEGKGQFHLRGVKKDFTEDAILSLSGSWRGILGGRSKLGNSMAWWGIQSIKYDYLGIKENFVPSLLTALLTPNVWVFPTPTNSPTL